MSKVQEHAELRPVPARLGIGMNVAMQLLVGIIIFAALNFLGYRHYWRADLSPAKDHTLSESTLNFLKKLNKEVRITVTLPRDSEIYGDTRALVEEYRRNGKKRIQCEFVDPARDYERAEQLKLEAGIPLSKGGILLRGAGRTRYIPQDEILFKVRLPRAEKEAAFYRGEDAITSGIIGLIEGGARKFYVVVGKGARDELATGQDIQALRELGRQQNFEVEPLNLSEKDAIPADASGVVMAGMHYDLTERELGIVQAYFSAKRAALFVMLDPSFETPRLDGFLTSFGVHPRGDRVLFAEVTSTGPHKQFEVEGVFSKETVVTQSLASSVISLAGQSESLDLRLEDRALAEQSVVVRPLIDAAERYWGETQYLADLPVAGDDDAKPPVHIAAAVERGAAADQRVGIDSSRMVVVGNALLLDPKLQVAVGRDFVSGSLNWMINREKLAGVTPKQKGSYRIHISEQQHRNLFWLSALLMPGVVLGLGFLVWAARRAS
ncbi:MAG: GldG family protein [Verrucomicrobiaceae bacterium]|nr:GldG family protein [Verrucomicrobiaceae bacterium]